MVMTTVNVSSLVTLEMAEGHASQQLLWPCRVYPVTSMATWALEPNIWVRGKGFKTTDLPGCCFQLFFPRRRKARGERKHKQTAWLHSCQVCPEVSLWTWLWDKIMSDGVAKVRSGSLQPYPRSGLLPFGWALKVLLSYRLFAHPHNVFWAPTMY